MQSINASSHTHTYTSILAVIDEKWECSGVSEDDLYVGRAAGLKPDLG